MSLPFRERFERERGIPTFCTRRELSSSALLTAGGMRGTMTFGLSSKIADFRWQKRLAVYAFLYAIYLLFVMLAVPLTMRFIDTHYPGVLFYHLEEGEAPGPIGDPDVLLLSIALDYIFFALIFISIAVKMRMPLVLIFILAILNEPIIFVCQIGWLALLSIR
ncbi:MAG: hypothetical protein E5V89_12420 [Mesorhizobium sp.]|nr:MAG: hypothetical protein E5V89_12420 [Mesorhizobium sp.]